MPTAEVSRTKLVAPKAIHDLVEKFTEHRETYHRAGYNEAQLRADFLDPFFIALGWDVYNSKGDHENYRDVILEQALRVEESVRAPDYCFRIGGTQKFFVEAKKPKVDIKSEIQPAFQLRRYAWTAKLPLSILTDFEELAVYDCRKEPDKHDKASTARPLFFTYDQYVERWDEIASIFSYDAIRKGSFDKYAESTKEKRGTAEVDDAFLTDIETWRLSLARNISLRNKEITDRELNFAVQLIIDRIIFLRMCEGRKIEKHGRLEKLMKGKNVYSRLLDLFQEADDKYNSGLFHFHKEKGRAEPPDELTPSITVDDNVLKAIFTRLYYPDSPYEFSVLPADILGQVYEQFLGKVIVRKGRSVDVVQKPEVRKAGGVYYTPTYIVKYIVENTVGKLLDKKTPQQVGALTDKWNPSTAAQPITVLDPACGSGSFLIVAYQHLLNWYLGQYIKVDKPENHSRGKAPRIYRSPTGEWQLTSAERKRILITHIFGVDIDYQAVEVTKLSLLLKVLEGETEETLQRRLVQKERALPDLSNNVKCGNSLIGSDFYDDKLMERFDEEAQLRVNVFDWHRAFPKIVNEFGGFDAVIGNPPYIDSELMTTEWPREREYCTDKYDAASGNWDIFCVFVQKALSLKNRKGRASMIVPNKLGSADYAEGCRTIMLRDFQLDSLRDFSRVHVFPVSVYPIVFVAEEKRKGKNTFRYIRAKEDELGRVYDTIDRQLSGRDYLLPPGRTWRVFGPLDTHLITNKVAKFQTLGNIADVYGAATVAEAYEIAELVSEGSSTNNSAIRLVNSGTIDPFVSFWGIERCRYLGTSYTRPIIDTANAAALPAERRRQAQTPKLVVAGMTKRLEVMADDRGIYLAGKSTTIVIPHDETHLRALLGILNSNFVQFWYAAEFGGNRLAGGYLRVGPPQIRAIPVPRLRGRDVTALDAIVADYLVALSRVSSARTPIEQTNAARNSATLSDRLNKAVYDLYGLAKDEIATVEAAILGD